jgi:AraC-like DNA-binding protein
MDYAEHALPDVLAPWVKVVWTLRFEGTASEWIEQQAMPDGCVELIFRLHGRSDWNGPQPERFAAGLATRPALFKASGDSRFLGIRLWPWTWFELTGETCAGWTDSWKPHRLAAAPASPEQAMGWLRARLDGKTVPDLARAIPAAITVAELARLSGMGHRRIQRWFERVIGLAPSAYLKLMRFQDTLARITRSTDGLALHAVDAGYADHAHMARDMRTLAGTRASILRKRLVGPFIDQIDDCGGGPNL